jgi:hypothetical protein
VLSSQRSFAIQRTIRRSHETLVKRHFGTIGAESLNCRYNNPFAYVPN